MPVIVVLPLSALSVVGGPMQEYEVQAVVVPLPVLSVIMEVAVIVVVETTVAMAVVKPRPVLPVVVVIVVVEIVVAVVVVTVVMEVVVTGLAHGLPPFGLLRSPSRADSSMLLQNSVGVQPGSPPWPLRTPPGPNSPHLRRAVLPVSAPTLPLPPHPRLDGRHQVPSRYLHSSIPSTYSTFSIP